MEIGEITQFELGKMYVLGGRPAMGKTMLALNLIEGNIIAGKRVLFCSTDLSGSEVLRRLLISMSRVKIDDLNAGTDLSKKSLKAAKEKLNNCRLFIEEESLIDR